MKAKIFPIIALFAPLAAAQSGQAPAVAPPFVVTGTRLPDLASQSMAHATVIGREEIESRRAFSLAEILRQVTGVHVIEQGGRGGFSSVLLRGGEPNFTGVFIDGVQVNDPTNSRGGSYDFSTLDGNDIERIEIIRGAQSAVFGSDALAGVINIVTRRDPREQELKADIEAGSDGYRHAVATASVPFGEHGVRASVYAEDDGDPVEGSAYESLGGRVAAWFSLPDASTVFAEFSTVDADAESFPEDSGGPRLAVIRDIEKRDSDERQYRLGLRKSFNDSIGLTLNASRYERDEYSDAPGIAPGVINGVPPIVADTGFTRDTVSAVTRFDGDARFSAALGAEYRHEEGDTTGTIDFGILIPTDYSLDRNIKSVFAEASYAPAAAWLLSAGLRYDDPDGFSSETTPRFAVRYRPGQGEFELFASWAEGFKLPSFYALGLPIIANPNLLPEESRSASAGVEFQSADGALELTIEAFRNSFSNLVDFEPSLFTNVNRSKLITKGVEFTQSYTTVDSAITLSSHATYLEADFAGSDQRPRGRPHLRAGVSAQWQASSALNVRGDVWYTDSVFESSVPTGFVELGSFVRADVAANWRVNSRWLVYAGVQNILDRDYEQAVGFPSPGRRAHIGLSFTQ